MFATIKNTKHHLEFLFPALFFLGVIFFASPAKAQPSSQPISEDRQRAAALYEQAEVLYQNENYEEALQHYEESYRLSNESSLLFLIGQCYRFLEKPQLAIEKFREFLAKNPNTSRNIEIRIIIAELENKLSPSTSLPTSDASTTSQPSTTINVVEEFPKPPKMHSRKKLFYHTAMITGSLGFLAGGISLINGIQAKNTSRILFGEDTDVERVLRLSRRARQMGRLGDVLLGSALVLGGLSFLEYQKEKRIKLSVSMGSALLLVNF